MQQWLLLCAADNKEGLHMKLSSWLQLNSDGRARCKSEPLAYRRPQMLGNPGKGKKELIGILDTCVCPLLVPL